MSLNKIGRLLISTLLSKSILCFSIALFVGLTATAQTNPTAQTLPYSQDFGTTTFTSMPAGMVAWRAKNAPKTSLSAAELSVPKSNAPLTAATTVQSATGCYGYCTSNNGRAFAFNSG